MRYLVVLGRQREISLAELAAQFTGVRTEGAGLASFESEVRPEIDRLGGSLKLAEKLELPVTDFLQGLPEGKIVLGVSDYTSEATARKVGAEALKLKKILKKYGRNVRVLPNSGPVLTTATVHHNQLGEKPGRVELIRSRRGWYVGIGVQNITAYAKRDQARPARDAKVGMLPPKLAQILINLCGRLPEGARLLDPFCGTGVVLQEAALMGLRAYGTDVEERMVRYTERNLKWLQEGGGGRCSMKGETDLGNSGLEASDGDGGLGRRWFPAEAEQGDATSYQWRGEIDAVAAEGYLGPPMSEAPSEMKLKKAKQECGRVVLGFLKNLAGQVKAGTPVVLAAPAWLRPGGRYEGLDVLDEVEKLGYNVMKCSGFGSDGLLYHREGQVVAREIIVLRKR